MVVDIAPNDSKNKADTDLFTSLMSKVDLDARMEKAGNVHTLRAQLMKEWEDIIPVSHFFIPCRTFFLFYFDVSPLFLESRKRLYVR